MTYNIGHKGIYRESNNDSLESVLSKLEEMTEDMWDSGLLDQTRLDKIAGMHLHTDL